MRGINTRLAKLERNEGIASEARMRVDAQLQRLETSIEKSDGERIEQARQLEAQRTTQERLTEVVESLGATIGDLRVSVERQMDMQSQSMLLTQTLIGRLADTDARISKRFDEAVETAVQRSEAHATQELDKHRGNETTLTRAALAGWGLFGSVALIGAWWVLKTWGWDALDWMRNAR